MTDISIGFTGSESGPTPQQLKSFEWVVNDCLADSIMRDGVFFAFHHGDCIGWDKVAHEKFTEWFPWQVTTYAHPGIGPDRMRAFCKADFVLTPMAYLDRDMVIAKLSTTYLIACPAENNEVLRSGTWTTVRYARKCKQKVLVIRPDGCVWPDFQSVLDPRNVEENERRLFAL